MDSRTALVTGAAGFLRSHLCDRLLADGHNVLCVAVHASSPVPAAAFGVAAGY